MPGTPQSSWTPGAPLNNYRQLSFGTYTFPLTFQEQDRALALGIDKSKLQFNVGDYSAPNTSPQGRTITIVGTVGSGVVGISGSPLVNDVDLEAERSALAGLQSLGKQPLYVRYDRYVNAFLESFKFGFLQDGGASRYAAYTLTFYADDPRYLSSNATTVNLGTYTDAATHTVGISQLGNTRAYPTIIITGQCTAPSIAISQGAKTVKVTFSQLTMAPGDVLAIQCDPRPDKRSIAAQYTPFGGSPSNALRYVQIADFVNMLDYSQFLPFIEATALLLGTQTFSVANTNASASYTVNIIYNDTFL